MNIIIYYLTKKIIISQVDESVVYGDIINIDVLKKKGFLEAFDAFAQSEEKELRLLTSNLEIGFQEFKKCFKFIYAAGGLIQKNDQYLFIFRLKRWDLPKGKFEMGETPEECAIRECEEECGITQLSITRHLKNTLHIYNYKGDYALKETFWYAMDTQHQTELTPQIEEDIEQVEWFNKEQIKDVVLKNSYSAIQAVIQHLLI